MSINTAVDTTIATADLELEEVIQKAGPEMADIARTFWRMGVEAAEKRIKELESTLAEHEMFVAEMIGIFGKTREEIEAGDLSVGNWLLQKTRELERR